AADRCIPKIAVSTRFKPVPYWNDDCSMAIKMRNRARNLMNRTCLLDDCINYRRLKAIAHRTLKVASQQYWQTYCSSLTTTSKLGSVWKMAKKMSGTTTRQSMPNLQKNGVVYETNDEKANLLATCYADVSSNRNCTTEFAAKKIKMADQWRDKKPASNQSLHQ